MLGNSGYQVYRNTDSSSGRSTSGKAAAMRRIVANRLAKEREKNDRIRRAREVREKEEKGDAFNKDWISALDGPGGGNLEYSTPYNYHSCKNETIMRLTATNSGWCSASPAVVGMVYMQVNAGRMVNWKAIGTKGRNAHGGQYVKK